MTVFYKVGKLQVGPKHSNKQIQRDNKPRNGNLMGPEV